MRKAKRVFVAVAVAVMALGCFVGVEAKAKTTKKTTQTVVFKDVTKKTQYYKDIEYLYNKGAYTGIAKKGGKFKPTQNMTTKEFVKTLRNLYGSKISLKNGNSAKLTQKYATDTLLKVSKQLGLQVTWSGGAPKAKVTRAKAAYYTHLMIKNGYGILDP